MEKLVKNFKYVLVFVLVELVIFYYSNLINLEMFFMVWCFIYIGLILFTIFDFKDTSVQGLGGDDRDKYINLTMSYMENGTDRYWKPKKDRSIVVIYLILLILNIIGYVFVMKGIQLSRFVK